MTVFAADLTKSFDEKGLTSDLIRQFRELIWNHFTNHPRSFPWRETQNPYKIFVSEWMLQQTQTSAVVPKYEAFITKFPSFFELANAPTEEIVKLWQGLGYNRRAIWMKSAAEIIIHDYNGILPKEPEILERIKGIGHATAREMVTFSYNIPTVFIETNIRRVFLHLFYHNKSGIRDTEILLLVEKTVDTSNPREWYYALMDYGVMLKKSVKPDPNHRSFHYKKQPKFEGSDRELRGKILRKKIAHPTITLEKLSQQLKQPTAKIRELVTKMEQEGFFKNSGKNNHR